ncbi:hypothetical protein [Chryseobacterium indologenes]|uniref:ArsR family transcriptional regulator n=1 Tax=Chryseobacterium indologenes TaxID=253 RepID=A0A0N0IXS8_CHRID|nr:hypothetical protein [Chryseobacterium indologenes]KPE52523.1 ArsR family transcriptional regulator [Chryseobacterium indologenes]
MNKSTGRKPAKPCYEHIGGKLGQLLLEQFVEKGWIARDNPADRQYYITDKGIEEFTKLGLDLSKIKTE